MFNKEGKGFKKEKLIMATGDGSELRHTVMGFVIALLSSIFINWGGFYVARNIGKEWEGGKTDSDSLSDIEYTNNGARYGAMFGSALNILFIFGVVYSKYFT